MTGIQAEFAIAGAQNEADVQSLIGRLSAPVKVPREHDFGIDFFCQLYGDTQRKSVSVTDVFSLQAKGMTEDLGFGGFRKDGKTWRDYELAWLRTLATPLILARIDAEPRLDLYTLAPVWRVLWQTAAPFEIVCTTEPPTAATYQRFDPKHAVRDGAPGDGRTWTVPLGPPFLSLTHAALSKPAWCEQARNLLAMHVRIERRNLLMFQLRVAIHDCVEKWSTNGFGDVVLSKAMFWSVAPGGNLPELAAALAPVAVNLGAHLQWQNDHAAYLLIGVLEWLDQRGDLDAMGKGLLDGLTTTKAQGLGPSERRSSP